MSRIEFIDKEEYCRFDGVLMTPEAAMNLYGYDGEITMLDEETYWVDDTIYTDKKLGDIIMSLGEVHREVEEYDEILSQGRGFARYCAEAALNNTVVIPIRFLDNLAKVKPFASFKKVYPKFNLTKYIEFMDCLEAYYERDMILRVKELKNK